MSDIDIGEQGSAEAFDTLNNIDIAEQGSVEAADLIQIIPLNYHPLLRPSQSNSASLVDPPVSIDPFRLGIRTLEGDASAFINQNPVYVLHARRDTRFECIACLDPDPNHPKDDPWCPICLGTGYKIYFHKLPCRLEVKGRRIEERSDEVARVNVASIIDSYPAVVYTDNKSFVNERDLIFDVEWDVPRNQIMARGKPVRLHLALEVTVNIPERNGETIYFIHGCVTYAFEHDRLQRAILPF